MIKWDATRAEFELMSKIAVRAVSIPGIIWLKLDCTMDINACHSNGCPLRLQELLDADDENFEHDVLGIRRHLNRETGQLMDCFVPRYAAHYAAEPETFKVKIIKAAPGSWFDGMVGVVLEAREMQGYDVPMGGKLDRALYYSIADPETDCFVNKMVLKSDCERL